jgi:O-antigen/teichoic acid export membrane protein
VRKLALNSAVLSLGAYISQIANVILYILAARDFGPSLFGSLAALIGIAIVVSSFADFGINGVTTRTLARDPSSIEPFSRTLTAKLTIGVLLAALWAVATVVTMNRSSLLVATCLIAAYLALQIVMGTLTVPFRAAENMAVVGLVTSVEKCSALGAWVVLRPLTGNDPALLPTTLAVGCGMAVLCAIALLPKPFRSIGRPSPQQLVVLWRSSFSFGMVGVASQILRADVAIVGSVAGSYAAGVYAAPARLANFLTVVPASFSAAVFPRLAGGLDRRAVRREAVIGASVVLLVMALGLLILGIAAPVIVPIALGRAYSSSADVLRVYLVVVLISSVNQPLLAFLQAEGHERYAGRATVAAVILGLGAIAIGARIDGGVGAAWGGVVLQTILLLLMGYKTMHAARTFVPLHATTELTDEGLAIRVLPDVADSQTDR